MELTKKKEKEFMAKIRQIKELENQKKQIEKNIDEIKNEIKNFMEKNKTSELNADIFTVRWTETTSKYFDSKSLEKDDEELYAKYLKSKTAKRFSIT